MIAQRERERLQVLDGSATASRVVIDLLNASEVHHKFYLYGRENGGLAVTVEEGELVTSVEVGPRGGLELWRHDLACRGSIANRRASSVADARRWLDGEA